MIRFLPCIAAALLLAVSEVRANVYATDIKVDGSLFAATTSAGIPVTISYRLNQTATMGATVFIWQGNTLVATIAGGTSMGLNSVVWGLTNNTGAALTGGTFSINVSAAASGFATWQQISLDNNAGNYAADPNGIAVDDNTNSPYYGRVVLSCAQSTGNNPISGEAIQDGIYKMNADGSFADEGGFGFGGYTMDDGGNTSTGEMPGTLGLVPWKLRIGGDDRIYMLDYTDVGAIVAFDMLVSTNQVVIDDGGKDGGALRGPHNYAGNPDVTLLSYGINDFDVTAADTTNAAVWLCNADNPNWGIWMYHLTNGASVTNDIGTQAVAPGWDLSTGSSGGCTIDANLDIFCGQSLTAEDAAYDAMVFTNWNRGDLPAISSSTNDVVGTNAGEVAWGYGCGVDSVCDTNPTFEAVEDVVINSRTSPTIVACPMGAGADDSSGSGIRLLNASDGSIVTVTNDTNIVQVLTNLDFGQKYTCAAWDNVGNLYAASTSRNLWRVWSPPGSSSNTTMAVAQIIIGPATFKITGITAVPTGSGCATVTITFVGVASLPVSESYHVVSSPTLNGVYVPDNEALISGSDGTYQATFTNCSTAFYKIDLVNTN